jgi:hypothetical protein
LLRPNIRVGNFLNPAAVIFELLGAASPPPHAGQHFDASYGDFGAARSLCYVGEALKTFAGAERKALTSLSIDGGGVTSA